jgi:hypothetical protein
VDGALVGAGFSTKRLLLTPAANKTLPQLQIHLHKRVFLWSTDFLWSTFLFVSNAQILGAQIVLFFLV